MGFFVATENGRPVEIVPELFEGAEDGSIGHAAIGLVLEMTCESQEAGLTTSGRAEYFVRLGKGGIKALRVRHDHFIYKGPAFDGESAAGKVQVIGRIAGHGKLATGTVLVKGGQATGLLGEALHGCHTGRGAKPKPLSFRLVGET